MFVQESVSAARLQRPPKLLAPKFSWTPGDRHHEGERLWGLGLRIQGLRLAMKGRSFGEMRSSSSERGLGVRREGL